MSESTSGTGTTRREFFRKSSLAAAGALAGFSIIRNGYGQNADEIRIGVIGCGGRGTGAADNCLNSSPNIKLVAMADLYQDRLDSSYKNLTDPNRDSGALKGIEVDRDHMFVGFDAFEKLLATDVDLVILATPPGFRPVQFEAAVKAGKHIFTEKPVAVDPVGIRRFLAAGELAKQKGLAVVAGTQRRHEQGYLELMDMVHDGKIGEVVSARAFWNGGGVWVHPRQADWNDMEYQTRNWYYFCWLCGDHIVEQHVHNLDVVNWAMGGHPVKALGNGGRQVRTGKDYGNAWDHFTIDYEYENGAHMLSMCRHWEDADRQVAEFLQGTRGSTETTGGRYILRGEQNWRFRGEQVNPYVQEHTDLIASIRSGNPLNESESVAHATMTAIMGRESAYTGKEVTWDEIMAGDLDLSPKALEWGPLAVRSIPMPGQPR
ncbi:MAG: Gfo/Idh/MocA family oxidoreductase [Candidatus Glassbacteria bacterium]|nr:Gfo/Idh/MocA family oxidoreductase [Candidatus Glassbacteria bacterium]